MLGVEVDLSKCEGDGILIRNKEGRADSVSGAIKSHVKEGAISARDLLVLLGRIQFSDAQVMGRSGRLAMTEIRRWSKSHVRQVEITKPVAASFDLLARRLSEGAPRCVSCAGVARPVLIFTDGASDGVEHTVGGCLRMTTALGSLHAVCRKAWSPPGVRILST